MNDDRENQAQPRKQETGLWGWLLRPKVLLALGGVSLIAIGAIYLAIIETAKRLIPPIAEREIAKIINREIDVGELERLSLGGLRLSETVIPTAPGNENSLVVEEINVRYRPLRVLAGRLPIEIEIVGTHIEIEQLEDGTWATINLTLPEPSEEEPSELPIDPQVELRFTDIDISVLPLGASDPLIVELVASARVRDKIKAAAYEVDLRLADGTIALQGESKLDTLESQISLAIQNLDLTEFDVFIPAELTEFANLNSGTISANLQIDQPAILDANGELKTAGQGQNQGINQAVTTSNVIINQARYAALAPVPAQTASIPALNLWADSNITIDQLSPPRTAQTTPNSSNSPNSAPPLEFEQILELLPQLNGTIALDQFQLDLEGLREPLTAGGTVQFQGDRLRFDRSMAEVGPITVKLAGTVDKGSGFDLSITVPPVTAQEAIDLVEDLEIDALTELIEADITAQAEITGDFDDPTLTLAARNETPWRVDRLNFGEFRTNLTVDRRKIRLNGFRLAPAAGGRIIARGEADIAPLVDQLLETALGASVAEGNRATAVEDAFVIQPTNPTNSTNSINPANRDVILLTDRGTNSGIDGGSVLQIQATQTPEPADLDNSASDALDLPLDIVDLTGELDIDLPLDAIAAPYELTDDITLGQFRSEAELAGNVAEPTGALNWELPGLSVLGEAIAAAGGVSLNKTAITINETSIGLGGGQILANGGGDLATNDWTLQASATPINLSSILANVSGAEVPVRLGLSALDFDASVNVLELADQGLAANLDLTAAIEDGSANVKLNVNDGAINLTNTTSPINLTGVLAALSDASESAEIAELPVFWRGSRVELATTIDDVLAIAETRTIDGVKFRAQADVGVGTGGIVADAQLNGGQLVAGARGGSIDLGALASQFNADIPVAALLKQLDASINADVTSLLAAAASGEFDALSPALRADLDLGVEGGAIAVAAAADLDTWSIETTGAIPVSEALITQLTGSELPLSSPALPLPATVDTRLSGAIAPLLATALTGKAPPIEVEIDRLDLALGSEFVDISGQVRLRDLLTQPDLDTNLQIAAEYDSDRLPLILRDVSLAVGDHASRHRDVNVAGAVTFDGRFNGQNLISDPIAPGNVDLSGDVTLRDPAANDLDFDSLLTGILVARTDERIELDLQGDNDRVMARLVPCDRGSACLSPFLPDGFELRYGYGRTEPILALGDRRGDVFSVSFDNFNLDLLNISPVTKLGINGPIQGDITARFNVNLYNLAADGDLAIEQPGVGYIMTDSLRADFSYDDGSARLDSSEFNLGRTQYRFNGDVDLDLLDAAQGRLDVSDIDAILATQVRGLLTVDDGQLEDLINLFKWSNVEDLAARQLADPSLSAADLEVTGVGEPELPLLSQLEGFETVSETVRQLAMTLRQPAPPRELNLRGTYDARVEIDGTIGDPQVDLAFDGESWRWYLQPTLNVIGARMGFFREDGAFVEINDMALRANYTDRTVNLTQADVEIDGAKLTANGTLSEIAQDIVVKLDRLQLDTIRRFVPIPLDVAAAISLQAAIGGDLQAPTLTGDVMVEDIVLNSRPIEPITSRFDYADTTFAFATTSPDWLDIRADAPIPLTPEDNVINIAAKVKTPALELLSTLSSGSVEYVSGDLDVDVEASVGFAGFFPQVEAVGHVILDQTTVRSPLLPAAPVMIDGDISLAYDPVSQVIVDVDRLIASVAEGAFTLDGSLPLYPGNTPIETPLTLSVAQGELNLKGLYRGRVDGQVQVAGSGLRPEISGRIGVSNGRVSLPEIEQQETATLVNVEAWEPPPSDAPPAVQPSFDNFSVFIGEKFRAELEPIFNFRVIGDIALNGTYDGTLDNLQADGAISIERGRVNALSNLFFIAPGRPHSIRFSPDYSLIDPYIDIELATLIYENDANSLRQRDPDSTELPDLSVIPNRRSRQLLVRLGLDGFAQDLLAAVLDSNAGNEDNLLDVVNLTSVPNRDEQMLVALLGNQLLSTVQEVAQLQGGSEFIEFAALRFAIEPTLTDVLLDVDNVVNNVGHAVGLTRLSVFPPGQLEGTLELTPESLLRLTYDYGWNGLQLRESSEETGANSQSVELRYEFRF